MKTRGQLPHLFYPEPTMQRRQINSYAFPMGFDPLTLSPAVWLSDTGSDPSVWPDLSGNSRDVTQGTAIKQPSIVTGAINGRQVRRFDGSNDGLSNAGTIDPFTIITVTRANTASGAHEIFRHAPTAATTLHRLDGVNFLTYHNFGGLLCQTSVSPLNLLVLSTVINSTSLQQYVNGVAGSSDAIGTRASFTSPWHIGSNNNADTFFSGDMCEVLIFSTALSTPDREAVEAYLMTKWGI